jgi:hypothetical protein
MGLRELGRALLRARDREQSAEYGRTLTELRNYLGDRRFDAADVAVAKDLRTVLQAEHDRVVRLAAVSATHDAGQIIGVLAFIGFWTLALTSPDVKIPAVARPGLTAAAVLLSAFLVYLSRLARGEADAWRHCQVRLRALVRPLDALIQGLSDGIDPIAEGDKSRALRLLVAELAHEEAHGREAADAAPGRF